MSSNDKEQIISKSKEKNQENENQEIINKSLKYSIKEASANSVMVGTGESFISAFIIKLGATNFQLGLLTSISNLISSISQVISTDITDITKKRKNIILASILIQSLVWIPLILNVLLWKSIYLTIILFAVYAFSGNFLIPPWASILGDLVDKKNGGFFFGRRNAIAGFTAFMSSLIAGLLLNRFSNIHSLLGFAILFLISSIARLISLYYMRLVYEPEYNVSKEWYFSLMQFIKRMYYNNFGTFVIYIFFMMIAVSIASPYFSIYMLNVLKLNYFNYIILNATHTLTSYLIMTYWGKYSDIYGNKKVMVMCGFLVPLYPLLWVFSRNFYYLLAVQIIGGIVWGGFDLSTSNFVYDAVTPQRRARCVSYSNFFKGIGVFIGVMIGSFILSRVSAQSLNSKLVTSEYQIVFLISAMSRFLVSAYFLRKIKEVRTIEKIPKKDMLVDLIIREPINSLLTFPITTIKSISAQIKNHSKNHNGNNKKIFVNENYKRGDLGKKE
ncbi:MAG: MFS transporter [Candidatus Woesearchaeota archaeon]